MSITHEYLKQFSYNRTKQPPQTIQKSKQENEQEIKESVKSEYHFIQQERIETEIQNIEQQQNQIIDLNAINQSNELNQSLQKTVKNTPLKKKQIFESVNIHNFAQPLQQSKLGKQLTINQQYNLNIDLHSQPKIDKSIQIHENSIAPNVKSQKLQPINVNPFSQANKEISVFIDQSQNDEKQIEIEEQLYEQKEQQEDLIDLQNEIVDQDMKEQPFLINQEIDYDYNKEEYLKIIDDYIEFIKIIEYIDTKQIESQILQYQYITSRKQFQLVIEPLIITMKFEIIPENPFKKNCQTISNKIHYVDFYDILKKYKKELEQSDYIEGLSDFMHYHLSQQTQYFLEIKKQQIQWNQNLYNALQISRREILIILQMYEQLSQEDVNLLNADIDAFLQQLKSINVQQIQIFQNLFNKYKKKSQILLLEMKKTNYQMQASRQNFDYEQIKKNINQLLKDFQQNINNCQKPISIYDQYQLLQNFQILKIKFSEANQCEFQLREKQIWFEPLQISLVSEVLKIFNLKKVGQKRNYLKAKIILLQKSELFDWNNDIEQESLELKRIMVRYQILQNFKSDLIQQNEEKKLINFITKGEQMYLNNVVILTQYIKIKKSILNQEISLTSFPQCILHKITNKSINLQDLINQTNLQVEAISQLQQYQLFENLIQILSIEDYCQIKLKLLELKNLLISQKFSKLILDEIEILYQFLSLSLRFFPSNIENVYIKTETYEEMETQLGDIKQFVELSKEHNNKLSNKLLQLFTIFFEKKIKNQFSELLIILINLSQNPLGQINPIKIQKRIDLLYEFRRPDYLVNRFVDQDLINQIEDQANIRELFDLARGFFEHLAELVNEDNCVEDIDYANDKILLEIQQFDFPQDIDVNLTNLISLIQFHKDLQQYQINQQKLFINSPINLGIIVYQQYENYLKACQNRMKQLEDCIELKINNIQAVDQIFFKEQNKNEFVPIYLLHKQIDCFYTDYQSILISRYVNKKERRLYINQNNKQIRTQDIMIFMQCQNVHNVGICIDDQLIIYCE